MNFHMKGSRTGVLAWALAIAMALAGFTGLAHAQSAAFQTLPTGGSINMSIPLFKSRVVLVDLPTGRVAVGNPDVADIVVINPTQLYVLAKDIGTTNVLFWSRDNQMIGSINLEVVHDLDGLKTKLHQLMPAEPVEVYSAQRSIILKGRATSLSAMNAAVRIAEGYLAQIQTAKKASEFEQESGSKREDKSVGQVINLIEVAGSQQVMLEVKVAEIARTEVKRMQAQFNSIAKGSNGAIGGVNGGATFPDVLFAPDNVRLPTLPGTTPWGPAIDEFAPNDMTIVNQGLFGTYIDNDFLFNLAIDAAKEKGLAKVLAEPTLTTLTGQEAEFLSGGQFPIPIATGGGVSTGTSIVQTVTIEWKEFGIRLNMLPTLLEDGSLNLEVEPEVSALDFNTPLKVSGFEVPIVNTNRASTSVTLRPGEHLMIGGLKYEKSFKTVSKLPILGSIPLLGFFFSATHNRIESRNLLITVSPELIAAAASAIPPLTDGVVPGIYNPEHK